MAGRGRVTVDHVAHIDESLRGKYRREQRILGGRGGRAMFQRDLYFIAQAHQVDAMVGICRRR